MKRKLKKKDYFLCKNIASQWAKLPKKQSVGVHF